MFLWGGGVNILGLPLQPAHLTELLTHKEEVRSYSSIVLYLTEGQII